MRLIAEDVELLGLEVGEKIGLTPLEMNARPRKQRVWSAHGDT